MKKPVDRAPMKPVRRATLLEDLLSGFLEIEEIVWKMELKDAPKPLAEKERRLYKDLRAKLRELISELTNDLAQEHSAA
jgi:hypothetical protein